ncbi:MAG: hypothetical protein GXY26_03450 [Clostridiales bacterium]|nr:hypothetical protein [Clostridiales bacterium]
MNRYAGNAGLVERIPENLSPAASYESPGRKMAGHKKKPSGLSDVLGGLGGLLSKVNAAVPDTEDLLLIGILYLLYRESGDIEFLLIAGAMLFM